MARDPAGDYAKTSESESKEFLRKPTLLNVLLNPDKWAKIVEGNILFTEMFSMILQIPMLHKLLQEVNRTSEIPFDMRLPVSLVVGESPCFCCRIGGTRLGR